MSLLSHLNHLNNIRDWNELLKDIYIHVKKVHNWSATYVREVGFEYCRFIILRAKNNALSPSNDIDKYWHQHILNTKSYFLFCKRLVGVFVHHDPRNALDQEARKIRFANTLQEYDKIFGKIVYPRAWNINLILNNKEIPNNHFCIKLSYHDDKFDNGEFVGKLNISDGGAIYLPNYIFSDEDLIKQYISNKTGHNKFAIKLVKTNNKYEANLEEMSQFGYC